jgi:hypothetical protein
MRGLYGSGDEAGELYDSRDGDFGGECGDDEGSGDGVGGVVGPTTERQKQIPPLRYGMTNKRTGKSKGK